MDESQMNNVFFSTSAVFYSEKKTVLTLRAKKLCFWFVDDFINEKVQDVLEPIETTFFS